MVFVESDFLRSRTVYDPTVAKVFRATELTDRDRAEYRLRGPGLRRRHREIQEIAGWISDASAAAEYQHCYDDRCESFH
jgi:hypothetical protein